MYCKISKHFTVKLVYFRKILIQYTFLNKYLLPHRQQIIKSVRQDLLPRSSCLLTLHKARPVLSFLLLVNCLSNEDKVYLKREHIKRITRSSIFTIHHKYVLIFLNITYNKNCIKNDELKNQTCHSNQPQKLYKS